jgi:hypothetical protein
LDYWEHPDYNDEDWVDQSKSSIRGKGFLAGSADESFSGPGETYFQQEIITQLTEVTRNNYPSRKLVNKWVRNTSGRMAQLESEQ